MKAFISELKICWDNELQRIQANEEHILKICDAALGITHRAMKELRTQLIETEFKEKEDEIWFFKVAKPDFISKLIYYDKLYHLEIRRPIGREKLVREFLENEMAHLEHSYENYTSFYIYYRTGQTSLDEEYFTRRHKTNDNTYEILGFDSDPNLSTGYDLKIANILAQDKLLGYLNIEIDKLNGMSNHNSSHIYSTNYNLEWTGSKTGLVELIYALAQAGVFNHGKTEYKEIAYYFEKVFNISLGNIYKTFEKIRMRECGPTTFLDTCKTKLIDYTDKFNQLRIN